MIYRIMVWADDCACYKSIHDYFVNEVFAKRNVFNDVVCKSEIGVFEDEILVPQGDVFTHSVWSISQGKKGVDILGKTIPSNEVMDYSSLLLLSKFNPGFKFKVNILTDENERYITFTIKNGFLVDFRVLNGSLGFYSWLVGSFKRSIGGILQVNSVTKKIAPLNFVSNRVLVCCTEVIDNLLEHRKEYRFSVSYDDVHCFYFSLASYGLSDPFAISIFEHENMDRNLRWNLLNECFSMVRHE